MFEPIEGGTFEIVDGCKCWIPPQPPIYTIQGYDLPQDEQYWRPEYWKPYPENYLEDREIEEFDEQELKFQQDKLRKDKRGRYTDEEKAFLEEEHYDDRLEAFRRQEWERRLKGFWFMNNGVPTFITGPHYYYLAWCTLDVGAPRYMDASRKTFYFRQYCVECPFSLGYVIMSCRGVGKTAEEVAFMLEGLTRSPGMRHGAIQSKSENDAKTTVFKEKMVPMYQELPHFFQPESNHGSNPEGKLSWFRDSKRGAAAKKVRFGNDEELKNSIVPNTAKEKALDGGTYARIFEDEIGKLNPKKEADAFKRAQTNYQCVWRGGRKVGIIQSTTTVEEMDDGGAEFIKIWEASNQYETPYGERTILGRYRRFFGVLDADMEFLDKFGFVDIARAKKHHDNEREKRKHDPKVYISWVRKNPYFEEDALQESADLCEFNAEVLDKRHAELLAMPNHTTRGDLVWSEGPDSDVIWVPNKENGRCEMRGIPSDPRELNRVKFSGLDELGVRQWEPMADDKWEIGIDPIQYGTAVDKSRQSRPVVLVESAYDVNIDGPNDLDTLMYNATEIWEGETLRKPKKQYQTGLEILLYDWRPEEPTLFYEYVIKICRFFGAKAHVEGQKAGGVFAHMKARGYGKFIMKRVVNLKDLDNLKQLEKAEHMEGTAATTSLIQDYTGLIAKDVQYFGHCYNFKKVIKDLRKFKPSETTKFDYSVAKGFTKLSGLRPVGMKTPDPVDVDKIFDIFDNSGAQSVLI